jgi:hypothetical protein
MNLIKIKSFIFEETDKEIDNSNLLEFLEDIVLNIENLIKTSQIIKPLTKRNENTYFFQISVREDRIRLEIIFEIKHLKSHELIVEILPSEEDPEHEPDQDFIFFTNEEDLKIQVLKFIFSRIQKYINTESLQHEKRDLSFEFQEIYKQVFKKYGFKVIEGDKLIRGQGFFIDATDGQDRPVKFIIRFDGNKVSGVLMSELFDENLTSRNVHLKNREYNLEKTLSSVVGELASSYDFYQYEF